MNRLIRSILLLTAIVFIASCNVLTYETEEVDTLDADGLELLVINHEEGDVTITGVENSDEVNVSVTYAASGDEMEAAVKFSEERLLTELTREGDVGTIRTAVKHADELEQGHVHLNIEIPHDLAIDYKQNEGLLVISSMKADMKLQHGANNMEVKDVEGDIEITDGAGNLSFSNITGNISLNKSTGRASITESIGQLNVIAGSASVEITEHEGDVTLRSGSGDIIMDEVDGDVTILGNRAGDVILTDVSGTIIEPES